MGAAALPIMIGTTVLGAATSAVGSIQQGRAAQASADYQASVARNNAIIAERKADDAIERGKIEEEQRRIETRQRIGAQRAGAAARGVVVDEGSALALTEDEAVIGELDALTIRNNAAREAAGFRDQSNQFLGEAELAEASGENARTAGTIGAVGSLLTGASTVSTRWQQFK